ncbi:large subunit GTPase 1 homolog [Tubulanus polymorphus]|uniref:large subunit GTPase 1 homolog n=1 Tax=Tubulanus polymorphus TaxID=672921 RepID=UPI003DA266CB
MGKKKKQLSSLGRAVIKERFGGRQTKGHESFVHTSELNDGFDWGRLNLQSVTEQSNLDDFLATAELAGTEFSAEKLNIQVIDPSQATGILSQEEKQEIADVQDRFRDLLHIPRRPEWDEDTTADELDRRERDSFLEWRRQLASLQEEKHLVLTPFEKNLDFWRQLWRVIERSDVVVQIVDARNPLLFRCEDLEKYVKEVSVEKENMILVNKADLLSQIQRKYWAEYFDNVGLKVVFWSALNENDKHKAQAKDSDEDHDDDDDYDDDNDDSTEEIDSGSECESNSESEEFQLVHRGIEHGSNNLMSCSEADGINATDIVSGDELLEVIRNVHKGVRASPDVLTIGLVGYPNVGKSSTINAILQSKKVPVSSTPGRTKHFQTLFVENDLLLCDCPGLVMPTFVNTKADMVINGILPIDQMRDHVPPVSRVCDLIPRSVLEAFYGLNLPKPREGEDPNRPPTAHELCSTYGAMRGFMTTKGVPDGPRSARIILKDFVNGKLSYCHAPPGIDCDTYESAPVAPERKAAALQARKEKAELNEPKGPFTSEIDTKFFKKADSKIRSKGINGVADFTRVTDFTAHHSLSTTRDGNSSQSSTQSLNAKPWKKHGNQKKKQKLRRMHGYLDKDI